MVLYADASGCTNACRHCAVNGRMAHGEFYSIKDLREIARTWGPVFPYYESTAHPDFPENMSPEITGAAGSVLATNGYGLAVRNDYPSTWARLREFGFYCLSFTLHGIEEGHDRFVCREGAYREILQAGREGIKAGFAIHWNVYLDRLNLGDIPELLALGKREFGVVPYLNVPYHRVSARMRRYEDHRPRAEDVERLLARDLVPGSWQGPLKDGVPQGLTEYAWLKAWDAASDLNGFRHPFELKTWPPSEPFEEATLYLEKDRRVTFDPWCGERIPLGHLSEGKEEIMNRLGAMAPPPHHDISPDRAAALLGDTGLLHIQGFSVRYKAISLAVNGNEVGGPSEGPGSAWTAA